MTFADLIRQRVQAGLQGAEAQAGPFLDVLRELAEGLTSDKVGAAIIRGGVRGRFYLTLWPRSLPAKRQLVLSFWVTPNVIQVFTDPRQEFADPARLRDWLADFVVRPTFLENIEALVETTKYTTEAYLRARRAGQLTRDDVVVEVEPEVQQALVEQEEGSPVEITVALASTPGAGAFDPQRSYVTLESSGVKVEDLRIEVQAGGLLRLRGIKRLEPDLLADFEAAAGRFEDFEQELDEREREMKKHGSP